MSRLHDAWVRLLADSLVLTHLFHILCCAIAIAACIVCQSLSLASHILVKSAVPSNSSRHKSKCKTAELSQMSTTSRCKFTRPMNNCSRWIATCFAVVYCPTARMPPGSCCMKACLPAQCVYVAVGKKRSAVAQSVEVLSEAGALDNHCSRYCI